MRRLPRHCPSKLLLLLRPVIISWTPIPCVTLSFVLGRLPSSSLQLKAVPSQGDEDEGAALSNQLLRLPDIRVEDAVFVPAPSFKKMKVPSFKINISKR